ncbi:hypothetical protein QFZ79_000080 [Arthrobacter sp. V4I6]|uniref:DUF262 domain-containing protein n=1 Tax=unclassified Arthrobacter TaxID=235627 RepID=UPI002787A79B|nr:MULTISPECIES: DUF262 domain-containing protein [unclassified Arthrobacter]MDQ0822343.1 hypothetical protein [Arthrobacter sp. V1I7]MDQ0851969.1 hypothetical protein [Arthrobacter sp. V4I6]
MPYHPPTSIVSVLRKIHDGDIVLPAIQREFVWSAKQIETLFDSLMRGYPIGGLLSWAVTPETASKFQFYGFIKNYSQYDGKHCPKLDLPPTRPLTAILDGQQRLSALNIGLRGTFADRTQGGWRTNPASYPERKLYLNVLGMAAENEAGMKYDFRLLSDRDLARFPNDENHLWFPVRSIYEASTMSEIWSMAASIGVANHPGASSMISRLWEAVHMSPSLHVYEEQDQDIERVLDIFIRVNSGGTVLSYSDLLLSVATAQWLGRDAREAIHGLVDELNRTGEGFDFSQDVVLKSGLVLAGIRDIGFRVKNFTMENMRILDREWDRISSSLGVAVRVLSDFGLSAASLPADSVLIPIAYYIHHRGLTDSYRSSVSEAPDREKLRTWVLKSLVKPGVWGSGLDTLLRDLRAVIDEHGERGFPVDEAERKMAARGKSLIFDDAQIEDILDLSYGRKRTFAVLAIVFPNVDTRNTHHIDHVFPRSLLTKNATKMVGLEEDAAARAEGMRDGLANLQLLEGPVNISKSARAPQSWAKETFTPERLEAYSDRNAIPWLPDSVDEFEQFYTDRRKRLEEVLRRRLALGTTN